MTLQPAVHAVVHTDTETFIEESSGFVDSLTRRRLNVYRWAASLAVGGSYRIVVDVCATQATTLP